MVKKYEVAVNLQQDFTQEEQMQGRGNIGACDIANIAPDYTNKIYAANSYVIHDGVLYTNENAIGTAEDWNPAHWTQTTVAEMMAGAGRYKQVNLDLAENDAKIIPVGQKEDVYVACTAKINDAVVIQLAEDCTDAVLKLVRVNSRGFSSVQAKRGNTVIPIYGTSILTDLNITNRDDCGRFLLSTNATTEHGSTYYEVPNDFSEVELNEQGLVKEIMPSNISKEFIRAVSKKWVFVVKGRNIMCLPS